MALPAGVRSEATPPANQGCWTGRIPVNYEGLQRLARQGPDARSPSGHHLAVNKCTQQ